MLAQDMMPRLAAINGLRGLAIVGVVWHHTIYKLYLAPQDSSSPSALLEPIAAVLNSGWLGVNLFFVLSGFVLYLPYARAVRAPDDWAFFYRRRAVRLLPLFVISLLVFTALDIWLRNDVTWSNFVVYLSGTYVFYADTFFPAPNWVLWSLGVEIWFSVLFPLIVLAIVRYGINRVLAACVALALLVRMVGVHPELFAQGDRLNPIKDGILGRLDDFVVGMWVCNAYVRNKLPVRSKTALVCGLLIGILSAVGWERAMHGTLSAQLVPLLHTGVQLACASLLVAALTSRGRWLHVLTNRPIQMIGMMCFSIYVWHGRPIEFLLHAEFSLLGFAIYLAVVSALAVASYKYLEFPSKPWRAAFDVPPSSFSVAK